MHEEVNNAFSRPWLFYMRQNGIIGTDLRKAILQKHLDISPRIKLFVEGNSLSEFIEIPDQNCRGYEIRGDSRLEIGAVIYEM